MIAALRAGDIEVVYQPSHIAANGFPTSKDELRAFDVVILSDIGANTLLLPDRVSVRSERTPNRLSLLSEFVGEGGGLLMVGGYLTFQGIQAKGNYHGTPVDDILPGSLHASDDRCEQPQGIGAAPERQTQVQGGYNRRLLVNRRQFQALTTPQPGSRMSDSASKSRDT